MKDKKSFLLYCDLIHTIEKMPKDKAGELFCTILKYVNDEEPIVEDLVVSLVFEPIKQQLKRDLVKYNSLCDRNSANGAKGGRPKKPKEPTGLNGLLDKPRKADSDTDTDNDTEKEIYRAFAHLSISIEEKDNLLEDYSIDVIDSTIDAVENFKGNKKYKSLYLTVKNWIKDKPKKLKTNSNNAHLFMS